MHLKSFKDIVGLLCTLPNYHALSIPHLRPRSLGIVGDLSHDLGATRTAGSLGKNTHVLPTFQPKTTIPTKQALPPIKHTSNPKKLPELPSGPPNKIHPTFDKTLEDFFKESYPDGRPKQVAFQEIFRLSSASKAKAKNIRDSWTVLLNRLKLKGQEGYRSTEIWLQRLQTRIRTKISQFGDAPSTASSRTAQEATRNQWTQTLKQLKLKSNDLYTSTKKWLEKIQTRIKTTTTKITKSAQSDNNKWSRILDKINTQVAVGTTKLRDKYSQAKSWLASLKTKSIKNFPGTASRQPKSLSAKDDDFDVLSSFVLPDPRPPLEKLLEAIGKDLVGKGLRKFEGYQPVTVKTVVPHLLPETASPAEKRQMEELLTLVQRQEITQKQGKQIHRDWWQDLEWIRPAPTAIEAQTRLEVQRLLNGFNSVEFFKGFDSEYQAAINSIKNSKLKFSFDVDQQFQEFYETFRKPQPNSEAELALQQFCSARATQMNKLPPHKLDQASLLEPQDLVEGLPKNLDLKSELFHYIMIKGFDNIVNEIPFQATSQVRQAFAKLVNNKQIESSNAQSFKSLFVSTAKEDIEWRESIFAQLNRRRLTPSEVFHELQAQTNSAGRITYAIDSRANTLSFLPEKDLQALRSASSNRGNFRKQLALTETAVRERNDQATAKDLKTLEQLRTFSNSPERTKAIDALQTEAFISPDDLQVLRNAASSKDKVFEEKLASVETSVKDRQNQILQEQLTKLKELREGGLNINPTNHPYADELFKDGLIDEATHAKLNPTKQISQAEFISALGTEEQFTKLLMKQFQSSLAKQIGSSRVDQDAILSQTITGLTSLYLAQLQSKAQAIYLKPDAFLKSGSFHFDEALKVYDPQELHVPSDLLTKAYIQVKLKLQPASLQPRSKYSVFFDAIKLKPSQLKPDVEDEIIATLPGFDDRIFELYQRPLVSGDPRLRGTAFENLTPEGRERLNDMAKRLYIRSHSKAEGKEDGLSLIERDNKIKEILSTFSPEKRDQLRDKLHELPIFETQAEDAPKHAPTALQSELEGNHPTGNTDQ